MKRVLSVTAISLSTAGVSHADCVDVIRASLTVQTVISDSNELEASARSFCQAYSKSKSEGSSFSGGASYGLLSGNAGGSNLTVEQVAQKYCDASDISRSKITAYEQYIETIAPGAFSSYDACEEKSTLLTASLNPNAVLPESLVIVVHNRNPSADSRDSFQASFSPNITCEWAPSDRATVDEDVVTLPGSSSASLRCKRTEPEDRAFITLATTTSPDDAYSFSWRAFQDGRPVDEMQALREEVASSRADVAALSNALTASVVAFRSDACPAGWKEAADISGRVIIGVGTGSGLTERLLGQTGGAETHTLTTAEMPSHTHTTQSSWRNFGAGNNNGLGGIYAEDGNPTKSAGGGEAHNNMPPFIALRLCEKLS